MGAEVALPVAALGATLLLGAGLGVMLWLQRLRGGRRVGMVAAHLLLGIAALEQVAMLLGGGRDPGRAAFPALGGALVFAALFSGLVMAIAFGRGRRGGDAALVAHAAIGFGAVAVFLVWAAGR